MWESPMKVKVEGREDTVPEPSFLVIVFVTAILTLVMGY